MRESPALQQGEQQGRRRRRWSNLVHTTQVGSFPRLSPSRWSRGGRREKSGMSLPPESASVVEKLISDYEIQRIDQRRLEKRLAVILSLPEEGSASSQTLLYMIKAKLVHLAAMDVISDRACDIVVDLEEITAQPLSRIETLALYDSDDDLPLDVVEKKLSSSVAGTPNKSSLCPVASSTSPDKQVAVAGGSLAKSKKIALYDSDDDLTIDAVKKGLSSSVARTPISPDGQVAVAGGSLVKSKKRTSGAFAPASGKCSSGGSSKKVSSSSSSSNSSSSSSTWKTKIEMIEKTRELRFEGSSAVCGSIGGELMDVEEDGLKQGGAKKKRRDQSPIRITSASPENQRAPAEQPAAGHAVKREKGGGARQEEVNTSGLGIPGVRVVPRGMALSLLDNPDEPLVVPLSASSSEGMSAGKRAADGEGSADGQAGAGGGEKKKRKKSEARKVEAVQQSGPSVVFELTAEERARPFHLLDRFGSLANNAYRFFGKIVLKARRDDNSEAILHVKSPSFKRFCQAITTGELQAVGTTYSLASSLKEMQKLNMNPWRVEVAVLRVSDQPWRVNPGQEMTLVGDLYFYEKVWDISSDWDLYNIMEHVENEGGSIIRPPETRVPAPWGGYQDEPCVIDEEDVATHFVSAKAKSSSLDYWFTMQGLMRSVESPGGPELAGNPEGLACELFPYQKETVQSMMDRERLPGGLNSLLWEEHRPLGDDRKTPLPPFFYNRVAGELLRERPVCNPGGFLCEEMGLGKTVEMISLILLNPAPAGDEYRQTLVVVPLSLLGQWESELASKVEPGRLKVYVHHCSRADLNLMRPTPNNLMEGTGKRWQFDQADVVLTTYEQLTIETSKSRKGHGFFHYRLMKHIKWHRVVLDESQRIQNSGSLSTQGACVLQRRNSWLMSGTPVGHVVEDLLGQLLFLQVEPYNRMSVKGQAQVVNFWEEQITSRWQTRDVDALEMVHGLLSRILIRHSKSQRTARGEALVDLPRIKFQSVLLDFADGSEEYVYRKMEHGAVKMYAEWKRNGSLGQQMMRCIGLRDRLLRIASHPSNLDLESLHRETLHNEMVLRGEGDAEEHMLPERTPAELLQAHHCDAVRRLAAGESPAEGCDWFTCSICLNLMGPDAAIAPCSHIFCYGCIFGTMSRFCGAKGAGDAARRGNLHVPCPQCRRFVLHNHLVTVKQVNSHHKASNVEKELALRLRKIKEPRPEELWALYQETMVCQKGEIPKAGLELVRHPHPSALYPGPTKEMPGGTTSRRDEQYPTVEPLLLAHYDVAAFGHLTNGAPRYGSKVDKALSLILEMRRENPGEKVVVFSSYTNTLQILECAVRGHSELGWLLAEQDVLIDGSTNGEKRTDILRAFREDRDMFVLLLSTKANNAGLTLTEASRLILIDLPTSPSMEAQLINRIHRIGQTREVSVTRLVMKGTAEERTAKMWAEEGKGGGVGDGDDLLPVDGGMEQDNTEGIAPGRDDYATKLARVIGMDE